MANFPGIPRRGGGSFSFGTKGYIVGGVDSLGNTQDVWEWNQTSNTWSQKANFPGHAACWTVSFMIGSKGYLGTGENSGGTKDFWEYNPSTDTWTRKADFGGVVRYDAQGFSIGSKGYIGGGYNDVTPWYYTDFWEYNPETDTWTQKANLPANRSNGVGFSLGNRGYLCTGFHNNSGYLNDLIEFNQLTNTWTQKASFPANTRMTPIVFVIGYKGYVGMGVGTGIPFITNDLWEYTPDWIGVKEIKSENIISISPNPATTTLNIECPQSNLHQLAIFNLMGQQLMEVSLTGSKQNIDISALPGGMYIVMVSGGDWEVERKVVKE